MTVIIHRKSIEEAGTTTTKKGEEPVWKVQFELSYEGTNKFCLPLSFEIVGPAGATRVEEAAYEELRIFLEEATAEVARQAGM